MRFARRAWIAASIAIALTSRRSNAQQLVADPPANDHADDAAPIEVQVHGQAQSSSRGLGDVRVKRELLEASPRAQTSELLSAAPGFFVDHEDGEGLGNDVYLRGFDLDHGSGIEMRVGSIPINIPTHILGQGYVDVASVMPEVVRSVRVLEGPYDPRQGDAAIVGSAYFDLGVVDRGYQVKTTYGSFNQVRVAGVAAPRGESEETFVAFALRKTDGFGENRASRSGTAMAQYGFDPGARDHVRLLATAYGSTSTLAGVVREDDVNAGRIGFYDSYPHFTSGQGVQSSRVMLGASFDHVADDGARVEVAPWFMWTDLRARQNFTGDLESSQTDPALSGLGDLFEAKNRESAAGATARYQSKRVHLGDAIELGVEPGLVFRGGHTDQSRSLLDPTTLQTWDRRIDAALTTIDTGAYVDLDLRLWKRLRISGGPRADLLAVSIDDHLANASRNVSGVAAGPRVSASYMIAPELSPVVSYGEGFRSLDVQRLQEGASPYSKVRSIEAGLHAQTRSGSFSSTLAVFDTWVANELVFEAVAGGLQTENASTRRGIVSSLVARPTPWLLASTALSVTNAVFTTLVPGVSHFVPNVPPVVFRADVTARGKIGMIEHHAVNGRLGVGYTFLSGRHLTDTIVGPTNDVLNAGGSIRWRWIEVGVDAFNVLGLRYADDAEVYVSNWSLRPGQQPASVATHITAAPPRTLLGTVSLFF